MRLTDVDRLLTSGVSLDSETWCTGAGTSAPPLVCASAATVVDGQIVGQIYNEREAVALLRDLFPDEGSDVLITTANGPYDLLVAAVRLARDGVDLMPAIWRALCDEQRVIDIQITEALDAVAEGCLGSDPRTGGQLINPETGRRGRYSLSMCVDLVLGRQDAKANDEWRRAYQQLHPFPIETWPETARTYPIDDARNTHEVALAQAGLRPRTGAHRWGADMTCEWCGLSPAESYADGSAQPCRARRRSRNMHDSANQVASAFALHLGAAWGFRIDQDYVDRIEADALAGRDDKEVTRPFFEAGLLRIKGGKVSKDTAVIARRVALAYGASTDSPCLVCAGTGKVPSSANPKSKINCAECGATGFALEGLTSLPQTPTGRVGAGRDPLNESGDDLLMAFADYQEASKVLQTYIPYLRRGRAPVAGHDAGCPMHFDEKKACSCPGPYRAVPLTLWPNVLLETGRVSYGGVVQQLPRKPRHRNAAHVWVPSLRECFVARPGCVLSSEDFEAGELITHGQSCIWLTGESALADALNSGIKVHNALGATMLGLAYDEFQRLLKEGSRECKDGRQAAKPGNFGFPGGMGPVRMVQTQRKQGPDTPHPSGPTMITLEDGTRVRGYKGLRFCILMDGADACGVEKQLTWHDKPIAPTCARCIVCAVRLKAAWLEQWPENVKYFEFINSVIDCGQTITAEMLALWPHLQGWFYAGQQLAPGEVMQHVSGRIRQVSTATTESPYCSAANGYFQALLADAAKSALRRVSRECYDRTVRVPTMAHANSITSAYAGGKSPLYGSHVITFQHDEMLVEHPAAMGHDGAMRVSEIMVDELRHYCPDLAPACRAEPTLMTRWIKGAAPVWARGGKAPADAHDRLVPYELPE